MNMISFLFSLLSKRIDVSDTLIKIVGIFGIFNYPFFYFIQQLSLTEEREFLFLRITCSVICIPLLLIDYWPNALKKYKIFYWYFSICYIIPFFSTYMFIENYGSMMWFTKVIIGLFWLVLITDWLTFLIILPLGVLSGWMAHYLISGPPQIDKNVMIGLSINYFWAVLIGTVFSRNKENVQQERLIAMKTLAGTIAHEMRTPLSAMMMDAKVLSKFFPYYQEAYHQAKKAQLPIRALTLQQEVDLNKIPQSLENVSRNAHTMITMLLTNLNETAARRAETCSMADCIEEALKTYPFSSDERNLIHWDSTREKKNDFSFLGHKELTKHVLFNLFKNALYAIASVGSGEISITLEPSTTKKGKNKLIFKDTGPGIPPENLRHIFDKFYTKTEHGTGIGLAFCKSVIKGFNGDIAVKSQKGQYTIFTVSLPILEDSAPL